MKKELLRFTLVVLIVFAFSGPALRADTFGTGANQFTINFVTIPNVGNANYSSTGFGGVAYKYQIGVNDISQNDINAAVANGLAGMPTGGWTGDLPATNISWYQAAAFVNWLNTSQNYPPAYNLAYSSGTYSMALWTGSNIWTIGGTNAFRNAYCHYFIPSENEWYKAAFNSSIFDIYSSTFWQGYTTGSWTVPTEVISGTGAGTAVTTSTNGTVTPTGPASVYQAGGLSSWGVMGMGGNVYQWMEGTVGGTNTVATAPRAIRGGYWGNSSACCSAFYTAPSYDPNTTSYNSIGFRVAAIAVPPPSVPVSIELAHQGVWSNFVSEFIDAGGTNGMLLDYVAPIAGLPTHADIINENGFPNALGWHSPTENGSFYSGLYLAAQVERARRTGSQTDINQARILANGLIKAATTTTSGSITGFIGRGFATDGTSHYPIGSDDQTHPWFYGLYAYYTSSIPSVAEKTNIANIVEQVTTDLQGYNWGCPCDGPMTGGFRGGFINDYSYRGCSRYLFMLRAAYAITGDTNWLTLYQTASTQTVSGSLNRLQVCARGEGPDITAAGYSATSGQYWSYIYVGAAGSLKYLIQMDPANASYFQTGLNNTLNYLFVTSSPNALAPSTFWSDSLAYNTAFPTSDWRAQFGPMFTAYTGSHGAQTLALAVNLGNNENSVGGGTRVPYEGQNLQYPLAAASIAALSGGGTNATYRSQINSTIQTYAVTNSAVGFTPSYTNCVTSSIFFAETAYYAMPFQFSAVPLNFTTIGNPGNAPDSTGFGAVPYTYQIGTYDVSQNQMNTAYTSGCPGIHNWGQFTGDMPASYITWYEAASFVNWLNTSQGYAPAYNFTYAGLDGWGTDIWTMSAWTGTNVWTLGGTNAFRNANARYFLPTENEWYKAAYGNSSGIGYYTYTTGQNVVPTVVTGGTLAGTVVLGEAAWSSSTASVYQAGGLTSYGAMGMGGNAYQWMEGTAGGSNTNPSAFRVIRGGSYSSPNVSFTTGTSSASSDPTNQWGDGVGFRVVAMPPLAINVSNTTVYATSGSGAVVNFNVTGTDPYFGSPVSVTNTPASGSQFPIGTTAVNCSATSTLGAAWGSSFTVTVLPSFGSWKSQFFDNSQLSNPSISGDMAVPAGDGIPNLMKYALNLNPMSYGRRGLPVVSSTSTGGANYLTFMYTQVASATDISYIPQVSSDLKTWYSGTANIGIVSVSGNGSIQTVTVQDLTPMGGANRRFMRLLVTKP